jgi:predicted Zn finger-like uncharacterized protein
MIVICQNCSTRLQLDESKVPARAFSVRCPKCQQIVNAQPPAARAAQRDAMSAVTDLPASTRAQQEGGGPVPAAVRREGRAPAPAGDDGLLRALAELLRRGAGGEAGTKGDAREGERRRVLVCVGPDRCEEVVEALTANQYVVFIAGGAAQAIERMREGHLDVIVLDEDFDRAAAGAEAVGRAVNSMRMADRRRVVFALVSRTKRTGDAHAAFLENANLVVNAADVGGLPLVVERNVRELNELYRDFNKALDAAPL